MWNKHLQSHPPPHTLTLLPFLRCLLKHSWLFKVWLIRLKGNCSILGGFIEKYVMKCAWSLYKADIYRMKDYTEVDLGCCSNLTGPSFPPTWHSETKVTGPWSASVQSQHYKPHTLSWLTKSNSKWLSVSRGFQKQQKLSFSLPETVYPVSPEALGDWLTLHLKQIFPPHTSHEYAKCLHPPPYLKLSATCPWLLEAIQGQ